MSDDSSHLVKLPTTWTRLHGDFLEQDRSLVEGNIDDPRWGRLYDELVNNAAIISSVGGFLDKLKGVHPLKKLEVTLDEMALLAQRESRLPDYLSRCEQDSRTGYAIGSECAAFMTEGDPFVRKFFGKDWDGCAGMAIRGIDEEDGGIMLRIEYGTPAELKARMEVGKDWPGLEGGEFSEHANYCEVVQRRGEGKGDNSSFLPEWDKRNAQIRIMCRSKTGIAENGLLESKLSIRPRDGSLLVLTDMAPRNINSFDGEPRFYDYAHWTVTPDDIRRVKPLADDVGALLGHLRDEGRPTRLAPELAQAMRDSGEGIDMGRRGFLAATLGLSAGLAGNGRNETPAAARERRR